MFIFGIPSKTFKSQPLLLQHKNSYLDGTIDINRDWKESSCKDTDLLKVFLQEVLSFPAADSYRRFRSDFSEDKHPGQLVLRKFDFSVSES